VAEKTPRFADSVFINCPFDRDPWPLFEAIKFSVLGCGFVRRRCLILDSEPYRNQRLLADIAGRDIRANANSPEKMMGIIRSWLRSTSRRTMVLGPARIREHFLRFSAALPELCDRQGLDRHDLQLAEEVTSIEEWLKSG